MTATETAPGLPAFPLGLVAVYDGYFGVQPPDERASRKQPERLLDIRAVSVRLLSDIKEEWVETGDDEGFYEQVLTYPMGWEYLFVRDDDISQDIGWIAESDLIEQGYTPAGAP